MKDFPVSEEESTQENWLKKKGTDGWVWRFYVKSEFSDLDPRVPSTGSGIS